MKQYVCPVCSHPFEAPFRSNRPSYFCSYKCAGLGKTLRNEARRKLTATRPKDLVFSPKDEDLYSIVWYKTPQGYFKTSIYNHKTKLCKAGFAHVMVITRKGLTPPKRPSKFVIDHINRDKGDNRRENLRIVNSNLNARNRDSTENAKRVTWNKGCKKWQGQYQLNGRSYYVGLFPTENEAFEKTRDHRLAKLP